MSSTYHFKVVYTKSGIGTTPAVPPVVTIVDSSNNLIVETQAATALTNLPGVYIYTYSGINALDMTALFHTDDATVDQQDLYSFAADFTANHTVTEVVPATNAKINIVRGDTANFSITGLGDLSNLSKLYFTVKARDSDPDTGSIIQIELAGGLLRFLGQAIVAPLDPTDASITIDDAVVGNITITLSATETSLLVDLVAYGFDVQIVRTSGVPVSTLAIGKFAIHTDFTKSLS